MRVTYLLKCVRFLSESIIFGLILFGLSSIFFAFFFLPWAAALLLLFTKSREIVFKRMTPRLLGFRSSLAGLGWSRLTANWAYKWTEIRE